MTTFKTNTQFEYTLKPWMWLFFLVNVNAEDIFRQDIGNQMKIGLTDKGYKSVQLRCKSDSMVVDLETEDEFLGVIYTRGSFYDKQSPCFFDAGNTRGQRLFQLQVPLDKCKTTQDGDVYSNVLVLQYDQELIMPGDAAFKLECDFNEPRDITVRADLHSKKPVTSRITLTDADPAQETINRDKKSTFESYTNSVIITPDLLRLRKEEL